VWQKSQIDELGRQIAKRENDLRALQDQNEKLRKALARMVSVKSLEEQIRDLKLGLVQPQPSQVWRLQEQPVEGIKLETERKYAVEQRQLPAWR